MKKLSPKKLFSQEILTYQVNTKKLGLVNYVNLDNAATTPPFKDVEKGLNKFVRAYGSVHRGAGTKSKISTTQYEKSRDTIKSFVNAPMDSYVIYTGNTTGAINTVAYFFANLEGKVAVSSIEHSSSWLPWIKAEGEKSLGNKRGTLNELNAYNKKVQIQGTKQVLRYSLNDAYEFDLKSIEKLLRENKIKVLVLTASSNVTGYCPDIKKIGALAHKYGAYFLVDACQYVQHHKIDMQKMGIDFLAASGHKFYAPYGGGFLIGPKKFLDNFLPYQIGGGNLPYITKEGEFLRYNNQLAHDPGTPNAVGAITMAIALEKLNDLGIKNVEKYENRLAKQIFSYLAGNEKVELYVSKKHLSTVIPFNIKDMNPTKVAERLNDDYGIGVRAGSFCAYETVRNLLHIKDESKIIAAVKRGDKSKIPGFVRASFSLCNNQKDVDRFIIAIKEITRTK